MTGVLSGVLPEALAFRERRRFTAWFYGRFILVVASNHRFFSTTEFQTQLSWFAHHYLGLADILHKPVPHLLKEFSLDFFVTIPIIV